MVFSLGYDMNFHLGILSWIVPRMMIILGKKGWDSMRFPGSRKKSLHQASSVVTIASASSVGTEKSKE